MTTPLCDMINSSVSMVGETRFESEDVGGSRVALRIITARKQWLLRSRSHVLDTTETLHWD